MFDNEDLVNHFKTSDSISINSVVLAEWNMNIPDVISKIGNYRYRPTDESSLYKNLPVNYDDSDAGDYYTNATLSYSTVANKVDNSNTLQTFQSIQDKYNMHYSLESCTQQFRPRSGINKVMFFNNRYLPNNTGFGNSRPRYYMSSRNDLFKYWTSYRVEDSKERGIANKELNGNYVIEDACPFIVYNQKIPTNRLVLKVQTNVGSVDSGSIRTNAGIISDPFFGQTNSTTPSRFKIQILKDNSWIDAFSCIEGQTREDGSPIFGVDGYLELSYYNNKWSISSSDITSATTFVTNISSPTQVTDTQSGIKYYQEFDYIEGIRVVVYSMNKFDSCFDLIEISPRLIVDISEKVLEFKITKPLSDMGTGALPVGQLLASTGQLTIFDEDHSFNENNSSSIIANFINKNVKFNFYENIYNETNIDYFVPIKTLYSDGFPQANSSTGTISISLRDFYFYFESQSAPRMLLSDVSLSYAISVMLDSIGFSNYSFKRVAGEVDPIIPYFFVAPNQNVAEVLNQLAISTQSAIFFDEYNNLIIMSKRYMMPESGERETVFSLVGSNDQYSDGIIKNQTTGVLPNIVGVSSENKQVYNDGRISYTTRYIQRQYGSISQANVVDQDKTWIYKPALLWEVAGDDTTKTINQQVSKQAKYVLGAMPLNSDLIGEPPSVVNHILVNNIIDVGENVYYLTRYKGYLYSSGEIIKYDAAQFNVSGVGNVWITSNQEYQDYFSQLPFNGKMYPTGLLRIFSTPFYETVDGIDRLRNGNVLEHGRAQFGTQITYHNAGVSDYWSNNDYVRGCNMKSNYLFTTEVDPTIPTTAVGFAGLNATLAKQSTRNSIIKNFLSNSYLSETQINSLKSTQTGTVQSSALVVTGPSFKTDEFPIDFISYTYKQLPDSYKHFGTRMRIIGKVENNENKIQTPYGSTGYYQLSGSTPDKNVNIGGGSGGLAVLLNPETNNGYYFEIIALTEKNIESYMQKDNSGQSTTIINNVVFYKIKQESGTTNAIPVKLWGGIANILVDDGRFTGQHRFIGEENPTVYDLSVEYIDIGKIRRFFLYMNNKLIATVDDKDPLPAYNNTALFVRGSSKCMFENIYALNENYSQNTVFNVAEPLSITFGDKEINANEALRKYAMSGMIQSTYLSGISSQQNPKYNLYFEEFGTIFRECAHFDIKYDKAYPALYAQLSPTFNRIKGYTTSGFYADSYGAEFLIFNATDSMLNLDETTGNYLRIQGVTFTQDTTYQLTVDDYFGKKSNLSSPVSGNDGTLIRSPLIDLKTYDEIKQSRLIYGVKDFTIDAPYIQKSDDAEEMLGWIINKAMKPKKVVGANIFATPILQLGDIVNIDYVKDGINIIDDANKQFIIYNIEYERSSAGPSMNVYLVEV
jgi:hypothetical protein